MKNIREIKEEVKKLFNEFGLPTLPIDLTTLAKKLNIAVQYEDLDSDISGFLVIRNEKSIIALNKKHSKNRQRFTFAHEIGHYRLHRNLGEEQLFLQKKLTYFKSEKYSKDANMEKEANQFAAHLLMPKEVIKNLISTHNFDVSKERDFSKLSKMLQVSEGTLAIHLSDLKYLYY